MVNVVVAKRRPIAVSTNGTSGVIDTTTPVTVKNIPTLGGAAQSVDQLLDVSIVQRVDNSTLVYDQETDTYVVKPLDFVDIVGDLDGGNF